MAIRTALLNGNNITRDTDFSKYIESVSEPGVIEGLEVSATKVGIGKAFVPCLRTNGETIYALVYNFSEVTISGNGDVFIEVSQTYIDDGELANEDGTGIATIQVGTMPSKNALKLATISNGVVTDERNIIPKVGELNTQIESIFDSLEDLDERVEKLEEAGAIDHLEESGLVGELYTLEDKLFKQYTPNLDDSTLDANIGDVDANTQIHIQRIGTGVASNQLKLKLKMVGASTQDLVVEVRKGVQVTVTPNSEAYWYGDEVVASGSIPYSSISSDYSEITVNLDNAFGGNKGELLDVVLYMATVNASNYYCVACDSTQYSEAFSYVSVNGSTRARSKLMPYCISDGFAQSLLVKVGDDFSLDREISVGNYTVSNSSGTLFTADSYGEYHFSWIKTSGSGTQMYCSILQNGVTLQSTVVSDNYIANTIGNSGDVFTYSRGNGTRSITVTKTPILHKKNVGVLPNLIKGIGELAIGTLYGMHKDNVFYGGIITGTTETVETGNITLGNAVGFLEINYNGQMVKVPYYK